MFVGLSVCGCIRLQDAIGQVSSSTFFGVRRVELKLVSIDPLLVVCTVAGVARWGPEGPVRAHYSDEGRGAVTVIDKCGQVLKGAWWMSWHREATKDVVACDKLREAGKRASIRRFLNEETRLGLLPVTPA